jgi:hypothetical protein
MSAELKGEQMTVWIVTMGEIHEGGRVVNVFHKYEDALAKAQSIEPNFDGGWFKHTLMDNYWINGCDFISIDSYEVL